MLVGIGDGGTLSYIAAYDPHAAFFRKSSFLLLGLGAGVLQPRDVIVR